MIGLCHNVHSIFTRFHSLMELQMFSSVHTSYCTNEWSIKRLKKSLKKFDKTSVALYSIEYCRLYVIVVYCLTAACKCYNTVQL